MAHDDPRTHPLDSGPFWFAVAGAASLLAAWVGRLVGLQSLRPGSHLALLVLAWLGALVVAGLATWRLISRRDYPWLLPLAAVSLLLLRPGRVEVATWRLEWGVFGLAWTLIAVVFFLRLLRKSDELERRIHVEGAAIGIAIAVPAATLYALFEQLLPPLRGQWVAVALLLAWWSGWMISAIRYR